MFPLQGTWSESEYFGLDSDNQLVEFSHGFVEFLPMPTILHQRILKFLLDALSAFVTARNLGEVLPAGVRVQLWDGAYREPDIVLLPTEHAARGTNDYWVGVTLVMEIVSDDIKDRRRDLVTKREEYAQARIPEYWIVDPELGQITVLALDGTT
jgi:Uma2 family endonuclease